MESAGTSFAAEVVARICKKSCLRYGVCCWELYWQKAIIFIVKFE